MTEQTTQSHWLRRTANKLWKGWIRPIAPVVLVCFAVKSSLADWNDVPTGSMKPTILEGDRIFVNKLAYDLKLPFTTWHIAEWADPARGDIVVLFSPHDGTRLVKRVVGLPGDEIELRDNRVLLNGVALDYVAPNAGEVDAIPATQRPAHRFATERLGRHAHAVMVTPAVGSPRWFGPLRVPEGHYFVMGDNRDQSFDSRAWGCVPRDQIVGRAVGVALSLDRNAWFRPRWSRFFKGLP